MSKSSVVPHRHRTRHLVARGVLLVIGLVVGSLAASVAPAGAAVTVELTRPEAEHLALVNGFRRERGLPDLRIDASAQADARAWAAHLIDVGGLQHDAGTKDDCMRASSSCIAWAENVGYSGSHERVFQLYTESPGHAQNMAMPAKYDRAVWGGIGVVQDGGRVYVVHRFYRCDCTNDALARQQNDQRARDRAFGTALHHDLLGRAGSAPELDDVTDQLTYGRSRSEAATAITYSDSWVGAIVDGFYRSTLGRSADTNGWRYWVDQIVAGTTPAKVASHFFASDEYHQRLGGSNRAWVADLFEQLLERSASQAEIDQWSRRVDAGTPRPTVAHDLYQSWDARRIRVAALYRSLLGRMPDAGGWDHWTAQLADGRDVGLALHLVSSDEYYARSISRFG